MASRIPDVLAALVTLASGPGVLPGVQVTDGVPVSDAQNPEWVLVGFAGDPDGDFEAAQTAGGWSDLATGREEQFTVPVAVVVLRAADQISAARARAYEIAGVLEQQLRAAPSLGLPSLEAAIDGTVLVQEQMTTGIRVRLVLTIAGRGFT
ncbi:hypothetical protein [Streptomyces sp. NPDC050560]|uniref:hypothetical protein n=1 Tax=Streptomyces sp. NPDC050560 TaxID=3365630 RepID=UPI0037892BB4